MNLRRHLVASLIAFACLRLVSEALANIPGGGTGTGANVMLANSGSGTVTLGNGIVSIVCNTNSGQITTINYTFNNTGSTQTLNLLSGNSNGGKLYWENSNNQGLTFSNYTVVANPGGNGGNYAEISMLTTSEANSVLEVHFSLSRGNTGFYVTAIWYHRAIDGAFGLGECRDNIYAGSIFNWMIVDATRNRLMQVSGGKAIGVQGAPAEVSLWTNGIYAGQYEDKYKYSADFGDQRVWGWSSVGTGGKNVGLWNVSASAEYYNGGPLKRELMSHIGTTILNMLNGGHYGGGSDGNFAAGEVWTKVCGPYFIYCNNVTNTITGTNAPAQALYNDALAQAVAEATAWPYNWFTNANYTPASSRGMVKGQIVINDSYNPNASTSNLWVGVVQQPVTSSGVYDFQDWAKPYQFWVKTDTNGNFSIPDVIAGTGYTLYAFGPGAAGTFQSQAQTGGNAPNSLDIPLVPFSVTVTAGATNNLGTVTWTPMRTGPTVFEIGYPDRTARKFRHGEDWWVGDIGPSKTAPSPIWSKWLEYPFDFPSGPNYVVGQSRWTTDWNFCQPVVTDSAGNYNGSTSTITFNLASMPVGTAALYLALASDYQGPLIVKVNGTDISGSTGYFPAYSSSSDGSDSTIREGIHGMFSDNRITFAATLLHSGQNTITLNMRKGGYFANHAMYDYVRLELTGYVPPPPAKATAYAGNNGNLICWPVVPGATSYNILRSTTSGSGYVSVTNGVTGPVCGSGFNNATWLDTTAANGTTYYYVVRSVNPVGSSGNSAEGSATPSAGISSSTPAAPTGLTIGSATHQSVTLNWTASSGANFYTVYRSTLFNNGGGASNVLGTIVLNNAITNTTYTDTSPTDGTIYRYAVAATSAGGTSTNSAPAVAVPLPVTPATPPGSLTASFVYDTSTNITLNWTAVPGAIGYVISRATNAAGPFIYLQTVTETTYTDYGLNPAIIYYYRVAAMNGAGVSGNNTDSVNSQQSFPTNLTATATNAQITLAWSSVSNATSYTLKRGTSPGGESVTVVSGYTGTTYTNTGLANGTTYYYVVTATGPGGTSGNSPEASATPLTIGDGIWISAADGNWGAVTNWADNSPASGSGNTADFSTLSLSSNLTVTLDSARTISELIFGDTTAAYGWTLTGTNTLTLGTAPGIEVVNQSATISTPLAGTSGLSKTGPGALVLGGATNVLTGGITVSAGSLALDFSAADSPVNNLIPGANALTLGGGTLQIIGGSSVASGQTFNGVTLDKGNSIIAAAPVSGANLPVITLGAITENVGGTVQFIGPATTNSAGSVAATAVITTTTAPGTAGVLGGLGLGKNGAYATVGLYDWATTNTATSPYTIVGGSQVPGFYQTTGVTSGGNYDVNSGGVNSIGNAGGANTLRFNQNTALTINSTAFTWQNCQGILVTPQCGAHNETISGTSLQFYRSTSSGQSYGVLWQNNPLGYLNCSITLNDGRQAGQNNGLVQTGPGTVVYSSANYYTLGAYLNGGFSVVTAFNGFGQPGNGYNSVSAVTLNGGTVVGNATFAHDQSGTNARPFLLGNNGGGLAATAGNTMTVDGMVGSAAGAGPLTIGIPASSANNFTAGLLPGSGPGTANATPVYATGTVVLTNANYFTGGTVLQSGTLNINGLNALGGANYGGVTFNGGTLQYAANFTGNNGSSDLTSIGNAGVTFAAGGGTIDVNGNAVIYAGSIGNGGSGALILKSSLANGMLILQGANAYEGPTTITNVTVLASNASGSATGNGDVIVKNAGTLIGAGTLNGSVSVMQGGTLAPGNPLGILTINNDLTLAAGSQTLIPIQHSPLTNSAVALAGTLTEGGTLIVTNIGGSALAAGDTFQLFSAANYAGAFNSFVLPSLTTNLVWNTNLLGTSGIITVATNSSPVIGQITLLGTDLMISGSGGIPGWNYYVLTATNLTAPDWTPIATNQFDAEGNFSYTNAATSDAPQRFYRLQLQ